MIRKLLKKLFTPFVDKINKLENPEYLRQIEHAYKAGYDYHQKAIKKDEELLSWISKDNYIDSKIEKT